MRPIVHPTQYAPTTPPTDDISAAAAGPMRCLAVWWLMCGDFANFDSHLRRSTEHSASDQIEYDYQIKRR